MTIAGYKLNDTQIEMFNKIVAKAKSENRKDFENIFKEVLADNQKFYSSFFENFDINITNIQANL